MKAWRFWVGLRVGTDTRRQQKTRFQDHLNSRLIGYLRRGRGRSAARPCREFLFFVPGVCVVPSRDRFQYFPYAVDQRKHLIGRDLFSTFLFDKHSESQIVFQFIYQLHIFYPCSSPQGRLPENRGWDVRTRIVTKLRCYVSEKTIQAMLEQC